MTVEEILEVLTRVERLAAAIRDDCVTSGQTPVYGTQARDAAHNVVHQAQSAARRLIREGVVNPPPITSTWPYIPTYPR